MFIRNNSIKNVNFGIASWGENPVPFSLTHRLQALTLGACDSIETITSNEGHVDRFLPGFSGASILITATRNKSQGKDFLLDNLISVVVCIIYKT